MKERVNFQKCEWQRSMRKNLDLIPFFVRIHFLCDKNKMGSAREILVLTAGASSEGSDMPTDTGSLATGFEAFRHKVWMKIKTQIKIETSSSAGYISICD